MENISNRPRFMVDENVGKLVRRLRLLGYDSLFFSGGSDAQMVAIALREKRTILTRDTHILERRVVTGGRVKALLIESDEPEKQIRQVIGTLHLDCQAEIFTLCLEDNHPLVERSKEEVRDRVPPYVFQTQEQYRECPFCYRIYWKGTHWQAMTRRLEQICSGSQGKSAPGK